jgi:hypothetical protein
LLENVKFLICLVNLISSSSLVVLSIGSLCSAFSLSSQQSTSGISNAIRPCLRGAGLIDIDDEESPSVVSKDPLCVILQELLVGDVRNEGLLRKGIVVVVVVVRGGCCDRGSDIMMT